jgi:purine-binding chemotaxis protein CheW
VSVHVRLTLGTERYALPVEQVLELSGPADVTPLPGSRRALRGVWNVRGRILPVVDLAELLGVEPSGRPQRLLVVEDGGRRAGLAIDELTDVGPLDGERRPAESDLVSEAVLVDDTLVGVLDLGRLLALVEQGGAP